MQELARSGEIGRKVDGRWAFTEREIARVKGERDRHALRISLTSTGKRKRTTRRRRSSSASGHLTRADTQALSGVGQRFLCRMLGAKACCTRLGAAVAC